MKSISTIVVTAFMLGGVLVSAAHADLRVRVGFGGGYGYGRGYYGGYRGYYGRPYYEGYAVAPVVVAPTYDPYYYAPVYGQPGPAYSPQPSVANPEQGTAVPLSGDYGTNLATLHGKLAQMRKILQRQHQKGGISPDAYERQMSELEGIEHDEHVRAFNNNGRLTDQDLAELIGRCDEASQALNQSLAE